MRLICKITSAIAAISASTYILVKLFANKGDKETIKISPAEVIFFTDKNVFCRNECLFTKNKWVPCGEKCTLLLLKRMVNFLDNARKTLDICIYLITCNDLAYAVIRAFKRGVKVRLIIDEEMSTCTESKVKLFMSAGIPVKSKSTNLLMHHKFCVIDSALSERKLLTGSLNWTMQGLAGNFEYVSIVQHPVPVLEYQKEFNSLWKEFSVNR